MYVYVTPVTSLVTPENFYGFMREKLKTLDFKNQNKICYLERNFFW